MTDTTLSDKCNETLFNSKEVHCGCAIEFRSLCTIPYKFLQGEFNEIGEQQIVMLEKK